MENLAFQCLQCGKCCNPGQSDPEASHFIPIYLNEVDELRQLAEEQHLTLRMEPDLMYFDELNNRLIIVTYALNIDEGGCPFYASNCLIYPQRPITCKAYPLTIFQFGETTGMLLKPECSFVQKNNDILKELDYFDTGDVFGDEFPFSREIQIIGNAISAKILQLESEGKIRVPVKAPVEITEETEQMRKVRLDRLQ